MELPPNLVPLWPTAVVRDFGGSRGGALNCEKTPGDIDTVESEPRLVGSSPCGSGAWWAAALDSRGECPTG